MNNKNNILFAALFFGLCSTVQAMDCTEYSTECSSVQEVESTGQNMDGIPAKYKFTVNVPANDTFSFLPISCSPVLIEANGGSMYKMQKIMQLFQPKAPSPVHVSIDFLPEYKLIALQQWLSNPQLKSLHLHNVQLDSNNLAVGTPKPKILHPLFKQAIQPSNPLQLSALLEPQLCPALDALEELKLTNCTYNPASKNAPFLRISNAPVLEKLVITEHPNEKNTMQVNIGNCPNLRSVELDTKDAHKTLESLPEDEKKKILCKNILLAPNGSGLLLAPNEGTVHTECRVYAKVIEDVTE